MYVWHLTVDHYPAELYCFLHKQNEKLIYNGIALIRCSKETQWRFQTLLCFKAKTPDCDTRASIEFLAKLNVEMQPFDNLTLYYPLGWSMYVLCSMEYMAPYINCWWWSSIKYYSKSAHFWTKSGSTEGWFDFNEISFTLFLYKILFCFVINLI